MPLDLVCGTSVGAVVGALAAADVPTEEIERMGAAVSYDLATAIRGADAINMLRIQQEREQKLLFPSLREYSKLFGLDEEKVRDLPGGVLVMHPGPINRGVELSSAVADGSRSVILEQVTNGLAVRMAVLFLVTGGTTLHPESLA